MIVMSYHYSYVAMYTGSEREVSGEDFKANADNAVIMRHMKWGPLSSRLHVVVCYRTALAALPQNGGLITICI